MGGDGGKEKEDEGKDRGGRAFVLLFFLFLLCF